MLWSFKLKEWENGQYPKLNEKMSKPFLWRTSVIDSKIDLPYNEEFIGDERLFSKKRQDLKTFSKHFENKKNKDQKHAISFPNLSGDTILVVPVPRSGKQFTNLYNFMKNASEIQQKEFWKIVTSEARKMLKIHKNIWISAHGISVNYLHVRICNYPKYYEQSKLKEIPNLR